MDVLIPGVLAHGGAGASPFEDIIPFLQWIVPGLVLLLMWIHTRRAAAKAPKHATEDIREGPKRVVLVTYDDGVTIEDFAASSKAASRGSLHIG